MRVITGSARGRRLSAPAGDDVRPTTDRVKEAVFSIIQFDIPGASFLDLFSGSGQMGIEALSRGASSAVFVDLSKASVASTRGNIESAGFAGRAEVVAGDSIAFLRRTSKRFDIAFLDPPYSSGLLSRAMEALPAVMAPGGVVICESDGSDVLADSYGPLKRAREYTYGKVRLTKYISEE